MLVNQINQTLWNRCENYFSKIGGDGVSFGTSPSFDTHIKFGNSMKCNTPPSGMDISLMLNREQSFEGYMQLDTIAGGKIPILFGSPTISVTYPHIVVCWFGNVNLFNVWIFLTASRYIEKRFTAATAGFTVDNQVMHFGVALDGKVTPTGSRARVFVDANEITSFTSDLDLTIASDWTSYAGIPQIGVGHNNNTGSVWSQLQTIDNVKSYSKLKLNYGDKDTEGYDYVKKKNRRR